MLRSPDLAGTGPGLSASSVLVSYIRSRNVELLQTHKLGTRGNWVNWDPWSKSTWFADTSSVCLMRCHSWSEPLQVLSDHCDHSDHSWPWLPGPGCLKEPIVLHAGTMARIFRTFWQKIKYWWLSITLQRSSVVPDSCEWAGLLMEEATRIWAAIYTRPDSFVWYQYQGTPGLMERLCRNVVTRCWAGWWCGHGWPHLIHPSAEK